MSVCAKASAPAPRLPSSLPPPVLAGPVHWGQIPCHKLRGSLVSSRGISLLETKFSLRPSPPHLFPLSIQWLFQWLQAFLSKRLGSLCEYVP